MLVNTHTHKNGSIFSRTGYSNGKLLLPLVERRGWHKTQRSRDAMTFSVVPYKGQDRSTHIREEVGARQKSSEYESIWIGDGFLIAVFHHSVNGVG